MASGWALVLMGLVAWVVVWSFYGFRYKAAPAGKELNPALAPYLEKMHDQRDARLLRLMAKVKVLPEGYIWGSRTRRRRSGTIPATSGGRCIGMGTGSISRWRCNQSRRLRRLD